MLLAAVGIYGLLNYWVARREPEIAVRLALGASPGKILRWTSIHALRLTALGVALGASADVLPLDCCETWSSAFRHRVRPP